MKFAKESEYSDQKVLEELILARINAQINSLNPLNVISEKTASAATLAPDFLQKYGLISKPKGYLINSLI